MLSAPDSVEILIAKAVVAAGGDMAKAARSLGLTEEHLLARSKEVLPARRNRSYKLEVHPDAPKEIVGKKAIANALNRTMEWVGQHLRGDDPIPARYTLRGLMVRRDRLELWVKRIGKDIVPMEELGMLHGRPAIAKALGISVPSLKNYMKPTAPYGRVPVRRYKGVSWAYRDALVDFLDSQRMGLAVGRLLRGGSRVRLGELHADVERADLTELDGD